MLFGIFLFIGILAAGLLALDDFEPFFMSSLQDDFFFP